MSTDIGKRLQKSADLLDVLGADGHELDFKGIIHLCAQWGVKPVIKYPLDGGRSYYDWVETIRRLARDILGKLEPMEEDE